MKPFWKAWRRVPVARHESVLRDIPLFRSLTRRERGLLELILHERTYVAGEIVFEEGEEGVGMYIVLEGGVRVVHKGDGAPGSRIDLGTFSAGETLGEMALLEGTRRAAGAIATESPTRLLSLFRPELVRLLESQPRIAAKVCYELACSFSRRFRTVLGTAPHH